MKFMTMVSATEEHWPGWQGMADVRQIFEQGSPPAGA